MTENKQMIKIFQLSLKLRRWTIFEMLTVFKFRIQKGKNLGISTLGIVAKATIYYFRF